MTMDLYVDMHIHTNFSDGELSILKILKIATKNKIDIISITDHDIIHRYDNLRELNKNLIIIPGIEFSTNYDPNFHVLGYGFEQTNVELNKTIQEINYFRLKSTIKLYEQLKKHVDIPWENFNIDKLSRHSLAKFLINNKICKDKKEAFEKLLNYEKYNIKPPKKLTPNESIDIIHKAGGLAVLAHPYKLENLGYDIEEILGHYPFDGIECFQSKQLKSQENRYIYLAQKYKLLISGGSDFHSSKDKLGYTSSGKISSKYINILEKINENCNRNNI